MTAGAGGSSADATPVWEAGPGTGRGTAVPPRVEALVVGGGITGVNLLHRLRAAGVDAWLVEARHLAAGASGRNAGFLLAGVAANYAAAARAHGRARAGEIWELSRHSRRLMHGLLGDRAGLRRRGSLVMPAGAAELEELREALELLRADGLPAEWRRVEPGVPALLDPEGAELDPAAAVRAIAAPHAERVVEGMAVAGIAPGADGVTVRFQTSAPGGAETLAGTVILATNAYTRLLAPVPIEPVRGQMLATAPAGRLATPLPVYSDHGYRYWRQREDGRVLVGGYRDLALEAEVGYDQAPTAAVQHHLDAHLTGLGVDAPVTHRWAGTMGFTPDELPLVGPLPDLPGVMVCAGYTGHGMGFAAACAELLVAGLTGAGRTPAWLAPERFPRVTAT
ncbi:MAG TPA: FAD-dependent oxidoreductase [Candidatus Dormibacteraeota bacterium]|nr:FAD-dependent oxidoreductase [Candidatus Dormibacteraeota bacterium]